MHRAEEHHAEARHPTQPERRYLNPPPAGTFVYKHTGLRSTTPKGSAPHSPDRKYTNALLGSGRTYRHGYPRQTVATPHRATPGLTGVDRMIHARPLTQHGASQNQIEIKWLSIGSLPDGPPRPRTGNTLTMAWGTHTAPHGPHPSPEGWSGNRGKREEDILSGVNDAIAHNHDKLVLVRPLVDLAAFDLRVGATTDTSEESNGGAAQVVISNCLVHGLRTLGLDILLDVGNQGP